MDGTSRNANGHGAQHQSGDEADGPEGAWRSRVRDAMVKVRRAFKRGMATSSSRSRPSRELKGVTMDMPHAPQKEQAWPGAWHTCMATSEA